MKNIKYLLFMLLLIPLNVFAIEFYCDRTVKSSNDFKCILSNSSNSLYNLTANLDYGNDIKLKNEVYSKGYSNSGNNSNLNIMGPGFNAPTTIGIFTFSAPKVGNDQKYIISLSEVKFKYLSSESSFHDNGDLNYTITVKGDGSTTSSTTTTIKVNNNPKTKYELNLYYMDDKQTVIKTGCEPNGEEGCSIYIADIDEPKKDGYEFVGWSESKNCDSFKIYDVYALNSDIDLYACFKNKSSDTINYLKDLSVEGYEINFSKFIYSYNISIKGDTSKLNVVANAVSDTAVVNISDNVNNLVDGLNTINIDVVDNDEVTTYVLLVSKNMSDNLPMLKNITIDKYNLNFKQSVFEYNLVVKYGVKKLNLNIVNDDNYEYEITGNDNISDGSQIVIKVKNGFLESNYVIKIKYDNFINSYLYYVYGISFGVFCIIVYFIVRYMRSDKYKLKKEKKEVRNVSLEPPKDKAIKKNNKVKKTKKQKQEKIEKL